MARLDYGMLQQVPKLASPSRAILKMSDLWRFHQTENTLQQALMTPQFGFGMSSHVLKLGDPLMDTLLQSIQSHSHHVGNILRQGPLTKQFAFGISRGVFMNVKEMSGSLALMVTYCCGSLYYTSHHYIPPLILWSFQGVVQSWT
ncbi:hypothetical protein ID866_11438 [Astraeus odoratus]|nr:hypothetical protein ID866_11438 [Astraeus odoratus]